MTTIYRVSTQLDHTTLLVPTPPLPRIVPNLVQSMYVLYSIAQSPSIHKSKNYKTAKKNLKFEAPKMTVKIIGQKKFVNPFLAVPLLSHSSRIAPAPQLLSHMCPQGTPPISASSSPSIFAGKMLVQHNKVSTP